MRTSVRAPGLSSICVVDVVQRALGDALQQRDPRAQRLLEVQLAAHRGLGHLGDLLLAAGVGREHLDHLALDQRGVDVHHDQAHAVAQQGGGLHGDVEALGGGLGGQHRAQDVGVGAGDVQVDGGDRVARHPLDAVDVGAGLGDPAGEGRHGDGRAAGCR